MVSVILLVLTTFLYAGYNVLIKISGGHVPDSATTTIAATICLQITALFASVCFAAVLMAQGEHSFQLTPRAYFWAALAGLSIGGAEIAYFYLFGGIGTSKPMSASIAIPVIVCGTIVITTIVSYVILKENISTYQFIGVGMVFAGIGFLYVGR